MWTHVVRLLGCCGWNPAIAPHGLAVARVGQTRDKTCAAYIPYVGLGVRWQVKYHLLMGTSGSGGKGLKVKNPLCGRRRTAVGD